MADRDHFEYRGESAILVTMHGKEQVIAPLLRASFGLDVQTPDGIDTDRFGTFSHDVPRRGNQLEAARAKVMRAFEMTPNVQIGLASEGSFGPAPFGFVPMARELVLLIDRKRNLELLGFDASLETNFAHVVVGDKVAAGKFARRIGFPTHGLIVCGWVDNKPAPSLFLQKNIVTHAELIDAVAAALSACGRALVETDMRAHRNPTRMRGIERATRDLISIMRSRCISCGTPGFDVVQRVPGLPCAWCGSPTRLVRTEVRRSAACGHSEMRIATTQLTADPGQCDYCNP